MGDYVTGLFREALGRLEEGYRAGGMREAAETARSLADDESKSYSGAHSVLAGAARAGEQFDPFAYPALAMAAVDDAIRRGWITAGSDSTDIERQLGEGRSAERGIETALRNPLVPDRLRSRATPDSEPRKMSPAALAKWARESAARGAAGLDIGKAPISGRHR